MYFFLLQVSLTISSYEKQREVQIMYNIYNENHNHSELSEIPFNLKLDLV